MGLVSLALGPFGGPDRSVANPLAVGALAGPLLVMRPVAFVVAGLAIPVGAWSCWPASAAPARWSASSFGVLVVAVPVALAVAALAAQALTGNEVDLDWLPGICLAVLPLGIGAAILRYRLYDLDRIISRTVAYGLLTLLLGGGYALVVLGLGQLLGRESPWWWRPPPWPWPLFQPARRRVQAVVDRRFNRRRHDTTRIIEGFQGPPARPGRPRHPDG